jgi:hypothetical protein
VEWSARLWAAYHQAGDQPNKPLLPMALLSHALSVLKDEQAGTDAVAGAAIIARVILGDFELLATAAGVDVKCESKGALARLFGR